MTEKQFEEKNSGKSQQNIFENPHYIFCSFCGASQKEVDKLIAGPNVYICDACVDCCHDVLHEEIEIEPQCETGDPARLKILKKLLELEKIDPDALVKVSNHLEFVLKKIEMKKMIVDGDDAIENKAKFFIDTATDIFVTAMKADIYKDMPHDDLMDEFEKIVNRLISLYESKDTDSH